MAAAAGAVPWGVLVVFMPGVFIPGAVLKSQASGRFVVYKFVSLRFGPAVLKFSSYLEGPMFAELGLRRWFVGVVAGVWAKSCDGEAALDRAWMPAYDGMPILHLGF